MVKMRKIKKWIINPTETQKKIIRHQPQPKNTNIFRINYQNKILLFPGKRLFFLDPFLIFKPKTKIRLYSITLKFNYIFIILIIIIIIL